MPDTSSKRLYYYTTTETMQSILTSGTFWATNILYMNDSEEYSNGLREIEGIIRRNPGKKYSDAAYVGQLARMRDPHVYTISFCTNGDLLSQWCIYARESGVNLELDFSLLEDNHSFYCTTNKGDPKELEVHAPLNSVIYFTRNAMDDSAEIAHREQEIVKRMDALGLQDGLDGLSEKISELAAQIKRYEFSAEQEWRLIFNMTEYASVDGMQPVFFRQQDNILKPFIKVSAHKKDAVGVRTGPWPVTAITVGPGYNQDQVFRSLQYFLDYGNYIRMPKDRLEDFALDLYLDKVKARCALAANEDGKFKHRIDEYKKKAKLPVPGFNRNVMLQKAASLQRDLASDFPECREALESVVLTSGGITLQKSDIPYIY